LCSSRIRHSIDGSRILLVSILFFGVRKKEKSMRYRNLILLHMMMVLVLIMAACGGGGDTQPPVQEPPPLEPAPDVADPAPDVADPAAGSLIQVSLVDGAINMPATIPAGPVTFEVSNDGTMEHSFEIEGPGVFEGLVGNLMPGEIRNLQVDLAPGEYFAYCPVDDHRAQGMEVPLTVQ